MAGARQVGKTTLVQQVMERPSRPARFASADEPTLRGPEWIAQQWEAARLAARPARAVPRPRRGAEGPWLVRVREAPLGRGHARRRPLKVVLLGSAPLLVQQGLTESLAGRFEVLHLPHWSFAEMRAAFGFSLDQYLYFGGYPGAAPLIGEPERWRRYVLDALVETTIARDVLLLTRVDKPALLRRLFELGCRYSGRCSRTPRCSASSRTPATPPRWRTTSTCSRGAGLLTGLQKYAGEAVRQRGSSPKLQVLNTALMTAQSGLRSRRRGPTASSGAASWSRRWARTWPTRPRPARASCSTGANATARWTSWSARAARSRRSR